MFIFSSKFLVPGQKVNSLKVFLNILFVYSFVTVYL